MMRSRFSHPRILNAQNSYAAYLAVSALLDVLWESRVASLETTCLDFLGAYLDGHPLRFTNSPEIWVALLTEHSVARVFQRPGLRSVGRSQL